MRLLANLLISFAPLTLVLTGIGRWGFGYRLPWRAMLLICLALYWLVDWARRPKPAAAYDDDTEPDRSQWPTSGPIGRFGERGLQVMWPLTSALSLLNPFQAAQSARQVTGNDKLLTREKKSGDDGSSYQTKATYTLPFRGEWLVFNGGVTPKTSHSWDFLGQRFALDFVLADAAFKRHTGRGTRPEDYFCYGAEILAAADGTVVGTDDRIGIAPLLGWGVCDFMARSFIGNYVMIEHAPGEYALYAHLIKGSVTVRPGDRVERGQVLGLCGHTGHSSEPHLHFHLQDAADFFTGMGLPVRFTELLVDGKAVDGVHLTAGARVQDRTDAEDKLDEALEDTFPASDPPANTVVTGVGGRSHEEGQGDA